MVPQEMVPVPLSWLRTQHPLFGHPLTARLRPGLALSKGRQEPLMECEGREGRWDGGKQECTEVT